MASSSTTFVELPSHVLIALVYHVMLVGYSCFYNDNYTETRQCMKQQIRVLSQCNECVNNTLWGSQCNNICAGTTGSVVCNGHGTCGSGPSGDGKCDCSNGWIGNSCQYSDDTTCNGHGQANANGGCDSCNTGFAFLNCSRCATNYYNYPTCTQCIRTSTCNNHGSCSNLGTCNCDNGYNGTSCATCKCVWCFFFFFASSPFHSFFVAVPPSPFHYYILHRLLISFFWVAWV
jgi:hypothetical protein